MSLEPGARLGPYEVMDLLGPVAWERCTAPATRASGARSPSRSCPPPWPGTPSDRGVRTLPAGFAVQLGRVWQATMEGSDRERAFKALEVATLLNLRRALRNGTVWVEHSLAFRSRERLLLPAENWQRRRRMHYRRLGLPRAAARFLDPLVERVRDGMAAVARAATKGQLQIDDELHLPYWKSRVLRRQALGEEDDGQGGGVEETA
jgi:hypothetical protein